MFFFLELVGKREARQAHSNLAMMALAAQGDQKAIKAQMKALAKEAR
jgi:hypothetical protein